MSFDDNRDDNRKTFNYFRVTRTTGMDRGLYFIGFAKLCKCKKPPLPCECIPDARNSNGIESGDIFFDRKSYIGKDAPTFHQLKELFNTSPIIMGYPEEDTGRKNSGKMILRWKMPITDIQAQQIPVIDQKVDNITDDKKDMQSLNSTKMRANAPIFVPWSNPSLHSPTFSEVVKHPRHRNEGGDLRNILNGDLGDAKRSASDVTPLCYDEIAKILSRQLSTTNFNTLALATTTHARTLSPEAPSQQQEFAHTHIFSESSGLFVPVIWANIPSPQHKRVLELKELSPNSKLWNWLNFKSDVSFLFDNYLFNFTC